MEPVTSASSPTVMTEASVQKPVNHTTAFIKRLPANVAKVVKTSVIDKQHIELGRKCTQKGRIYFQSQLTFCMMNVSKLKPYIIASD